MALARRERPGIELPEIWRRFFEGNLDTEGMGMVRVEEFRDGNDVVVRAELPGIDPDKDVELTVSDGTLRIMARREERSEKREKDAYRTEFRYGTFVRELVLPPGVEEKDIDASYKDGILEIRVPLGEERKPPVRRITVNRKK